ncbi:MAG: HEPN domain-containing protein [Methanoregulaceae archaeon]|nr:MAG: HEPN domain-containing protein [Methanoregulaceae archaeon]
MAQQCARATLTVHEQGRSGIRSCTKTCALTASRPLEKSLKALLVACDMESPHTHIIAHLLETLEQGGLEIPEDVKSSSDLTEYAVHTRYPGLYEPVTAKEFREALAVAGRVHEWVVAHINLMASRKSKNNP